MKEQFTIDTMVEKYMPWFSKEFRITEHNLREHYEWYRLKQPTASVNDFIWYIFNFLLSENAKQSKNIMHFYRHQLDITLAMWEFRVVIERKKDNRLVQDVQLARINYDVESSPYEVDVEVGSGGCCPFCDSLKGKVYTVEQYKKEQPLGSEKCTNEKGCNCRVLSVPLRNSDGRLRLKE